MIQRPKVHCDDCGWEDSVATLRHLRAWYRAACPECGQGELLDERECRVSEELIALEAEGLIWQAGTQPERAGLRATLNTAADDIFVIHDSP